MKGEMALIGPRPERPEIVAVLADEIPNYTNRLIVLPGVTGLTQINLPPDSTLDDVRRKLVLDMEYIREAGLWLDLRILLSTFVRLLGIPGVRVMSIFRLRRPSPRIHSGYPVVPAVHLNDISINIGGNGNGNGHGNGKSDGNPANNDNPIIEDDSLLETTTTFSATPGKPR